MTRDTMPSRWWSGQKKRLSSEEIKKMKKAYSKVEKLALLSDIHKQQEANEAEKLLEDMDVREQPKKTTLHNQTK